MRISDWSSDVCSSDLVLTLTRRPVDRGRRLREPARPCVGHVETILQPHAELAGDIDARFIREAHARGELRRLPANEVDRLVPVEADAVAGAVRSPRDLVPGAYTETLALKIGTA